MLIYPLLVYTFSIHRTCIVSLVIYISLYLSCVVYHAFNRIISYFSCLLHMAIICISHNHIIIFVFIHIVCSNTTLSSFYSYTLHALIPSYMHMLMHMHTYVSCTFITFAHIHAYMPFHIHSTIIFTCKTCIHAFPYS